DDAAAADAGRHFIAAESLQPLGDQGRGARKVVEKFRMPMNIAAPILRIGDKLVNRGIDRHGREHQRNLKVAATGSRSQSVFDPFKRWESRGSHARPSADLASFSAFVATETPPAPPTG